MHTLSACTLPPPAEAAPQGAGAQPLCQVQALLFHVRRNPQPAELAQHEEQGAGEGARPGGDDDRAQDLGGGGGGRWECL